jgi:hypothetical protein
VGGGVGVVNADGTEGTGGPRTGWLPSARRGSRSTALTVTVNDPTGNARVHTSAVEPSERPTSRLAPCCTCGVIHRSAPLCALPVPFLPYAHNQYPYVRYQYRSCLMRIISTLIRTLSTIGAADLKAARTGDAAHVRGTLHVCLRMSYTYCMLHSCSSHSGVCSTAHVAY